jgi:hypothetical protein
MSSDAVAIVRIGSQDYPFRCRIFRNIDPDAISAVDPDDDECIEKVEADRRPDQRTQLGASSKMQTLVSLTDTGPLSQWLFSRRARATIAFFIPRRLAICMQLAVGRETLSYAAVGLIYR